MKRRGHGDGSILERGADTFRLRYCVDGKRFSKTFHGTKSEAQKELRRLLKSGDDGQHIAPDRLKLAEWCEKWLTLLERKPEAGAARRRGLVNPRTAERYRELLTLYVMPTLGARPLQKLAATEIDALYVDLEARLSARTVHHVHVVLQACLNSAVRKKLIPTNPAADAEAPSPGDVDVGQCLDAEQLETVVRGFREAALFPIVAVAAYTGARRNEILALQWSDLDAENSTLRIERALEETKGEGDGSGPRRRLKEPKTARGKRTIKIDAGLLALLLAEREKHLRLRAGLPDGATVAAIVAKLPDGALMFPSVEGESVDLRRLRDAHTVSQSFRRHATKLGFLHLRFHDLRASHETILLDAGVPVHVVAARCGHDPAVLLRSYAKRTKKADTSAAEVIGSLSKGALG